MVYSVGHSDHLAQSAETARNCFPTECIMRPWTNRERATPKEGTRHCRVSTTTGRAGILWWDGCAAAAY